MIINERLNPIYDDGFALTESSSYYVIDEAAKGTYRLDV